MTENTTAVTIPPVDEEFQPIRALNDLLFCERRCFLHRVEGVWVENVHTIAGSLDHRRVHQARDAEEGAFRTARGLPLLSHRLRLVGVADMVEFHPNPGGGADIPFPIEYKRGKRRRWDNDEVQLCAQALCLEEMLGVSIPAGAIYHVRSRRRRDVALDEKLRRQTELAVIRLHELLKQTNAPAPKLHPKCKQCSLYRVCMPELITAQSAYQHAAKSLFHPSD